MSTPPLDPIEVGEIPLLDSARAALISLNRPDQLNPIDWPTVRRLEDCLHIADDDNDVRVVLITGRGRAFSAGGDLKSYQTLQRDPVGFPQFLEDLHRTFSNIKFMRKPVVALVNGITAAGGLELLLSCDFAIAAESARIADAHLAYGQMGGGGVLTMLPRAIGPARARELIFSGKWLDAHEARDWGIVNSVVSDDQLMQAGKNFAKAVADRSALAVANAKHVLNVGLAQGTHIDETLQLERERAAFYSLTSKDSAEGIAAFVEKRKPRYRGE